MPHHDLNATDEPITVKIGNKTLPLRRVQDLPFSESLTFDAIELPDGGVERLDALFAKLAVILPGLERADMDGMTARQLNAVLKLSTDGDDLGNGGSDATAKASE